MKDTPIHPIQTVARRTGLTADVIRAWERRYRAVEPRRSETRRRLYSEADVERLLLLRRATLGGRRIGDVAHMPTEELAPLVAADETAAANAPRPRVALPGPSPVGYCRAALDAVTALDADGLESTLRRAARDLSTETLIREVLTPTVEAIGDGWADGTLRVGNEHFATAVIRSLLENMRTAQSRAFGGPEMVVATPAGQVHELGALMVAAIAAADGWRVTYLGADVPAADIAAAAATKLAKVVALSLVFPEADAGTAAQLVALRRHLPRETSIVVGGRAADSYAETVESIGAQTLTDTRELTNALSAARARAGFA